jgi:hypothetical protein
MAKKMFVRCSLCDKALIERMPNGLWNFSFGRPIAEDKENPTIIERIAPVRMLVYGSIKMRCLRKSCRIRHPDHWELLTFFPTINKDNAIGITEDSGMNKH